MPTNANHMQQEYVRNLVTFEPSMSACTVSSIVVVCEWGILHNYCASECDIFTLDLDLVTAV
jgi:hypothetical protein